MKYLLDTCAISELVKPKPNKNVIRWFQEENEADLYLSVLTIGEIRKGISKLPDSRKKDILVHWVENDLKKRFDGRLLDINEDIAGTWGELQGQLETVGKKISVIDGLIAATAIVESITVVTRNIKDMEHSGCNIFNPWE